MLGGTPQIVIGCVIYAHEISTLTNEAHWDAYLCRYMQMGFFCCSKLELAV